VKGGCFLVVSLLYLLFRLAVAAFRLRWREFKELEIVDRRMSRSPWNFGGGPVM